MDISIVVTSVNGARFAFNPQAVQSFSEDRSINSNKTLLTFTNGDRQYVDDPFPTILRWIQGSEWSGNTP